MRAETDLILSVSAHRKANGELASMEDFLQAIQSGARN
jgi:hypothetical protein